MAILFATQTALSNPRWVSLLGGAIVGAMGDAANDSGDGQNPADRLIDRREARSRLVRGIEINNKGGEITDDQGILPSIFAFVGRLGIVSAPANNGIAARHFSEAVYNNDPSFAEARARAVDTVTNSLSGAFSRIAARAEAERRINVVALNRRRRFEGARQYAVRLASDALDLAA